MIKKQKAALIFIAAAIFIGLISVKLFFLDKPEINLGAVVNQPSQDNTVFDKNADAAVIQALPSSAAQDSALQKCFSTDADESDLNSLVSFFEIRAALSAPIKDEERYELRNSKGENLVVQYFPQEADKEKVRAFSISKEDGLPDRIKDFPANGAEVSERLKGALSLGEILISTETTQQSGQNGEMLEIEKTKSQVVRVRYTEPGLEYSCEQKRCKCTKLEN